MTRDLKRITRKPRWIEDFGKYGNMWVIFSEHDSKVVATFKAQWRLENVFSDFAANKIDHC